MTVPRKASARASREQATPKAGPVLTPPGLEDALRPVMQRLIQEALETEFTHFVGAARHERAPSRRGWRNGHRDRTLLTRVGRLTLRVPRDRAGEFQPTLFARYQRSEQALVLALAEMYLQGVSTRKVSAIVEQLCGATVSASAVSACAKTLDASLAAWRGRSLREVAYPFLIVDAHHEDIRREGHVLSTAALWVIGVRADGRREHLGLWLGASESGASWAAACRDLKQRGLHGVRYIVSDDHGGLVEALRRYFPEAVHQRCQVHYLRNALAKVSTAALEHELLTGLREVWAAPTRASAETRARELTAPTSLLRRSAPNVADWIEATLPETLAVYMLPEAEARRRLRTTNAVEHDHAEVRRRTRVIRIFPNEASFLRLATALAVERTEHWAARRYFVPAKLITTERIMRTA
jgi:putative transposase